MYSIFHPYANLCPGPFGELTQHGPPHEHLFSPDRDPKREMSFNNRRCTPYCSGVCTADLCLYSTFSIHGCAAICRRDAPRPIQIRSLNRTRRHAKPVLPVLLHDSVHQHPGDPEQAQFADSACCIKQRQIRAADMTICVWKVANRITVSPRGERCFPDIHHRRPSPGRG
jgi:hypothetical protein